MNDILPAFVDFFDLAVPTFTIIAAVTLLACLLMWAANRAIHRHQIGLIGAFAIIGGCPGLIAGYSQQEIAGAFLSGLITIVAALGTYALGKESLAIYRPAIPFVIAATAFTAVGGFAAGSYAKKRWLLYDQGVQDRRDEMQMVELPVERERQLLNLRALAAKQAEPVSRQDLDRIR